MSVEANGFVLCTARKPLGWCDLFDGSDSCISKSRGTWLKNLTDPDFNPFSVLRWLQADPLRCMLQGRIIARWRFIMYSLILTTKHSPQLNEYEDARLNSGCCWMIHVCLLVPAFLLACLLSIRAKLTLFIEAAPSFSFVWPPLLV